MHSPLDDGFFVQKEHEPGYIPDITRHHWLQTVQASGGLSIALFVVVGLFAIALTRTSSDEDRVLFSIFLLLALVAGLLLGRFSQHLRAAVVHEDQSRLERGLFRFENFIIFLCVLSVGVALVLGLTLWNKGF